MSRTGDVWAIGPQRLICGDATDPTVVATLLQGDSVRLRFTSPPYGNQREYTSGGIDPAFGHTTQKYSRVVPASICSPMPPSS